MLSKEERDKLVIENQGLVWQVIHDLGLASRNDVEDIAQVGMIGLIKAAIAWDQQKAKYSTYATCCARGYILTHLQSNLDFISIPACVPPEERRTLQKNLRARSLLFPENMPGKGLEPIDIAINCEPPEGFCEVRKVMLSLGREGEMAIKHYVGGKKLKEIAKEYNVTLERVRQLVARAVKRTRKVFNDRADRAKEAKGEEEAEV